MDVELFEAKEDYPGREGDDSFLPLQKGDVVKVVEKQIVYYVVEKDGRIGKVLKGKMKPYSGGEALQSISNTNQIVSSSSASNLPPISQIKPLSIQNPVSSSQTSLQPLTQRSQSQFGITQSQIVSQLQQGNQGGFVPKQTGQKAEQKQLNVKQNGQKIKISLLLVSNSINEILEHILL